MRNYFSSVVLLLGVLSLNPAFASDGGYLSVAFDMSFGGNTPQTYSASYGVGHRAVDEVEQKIVAIRSPITGFTYTSGFGFTPTLFGVQVETLNQLNAAGENGPWYKSWWAIGAGVAIVAGIVIAADSGSDSSGGDDPDDPDEGGSPICFDNDVIFGNECIP